MDHSKEGHRQGHTTYDKARFDDYVPPIPKQLSSTSSSDKSYRLKKGLKDKKSIVRTKRKRVMLTRSKPLPKFANIHQQRRNL